MARPAPKKRSLADRVASSTGYDPNRPRTDAAMPDPETMGSPARWGGYAKSAGEGGIGWTLPHAGSLGAAAMAAAGIGKGIHDLWKNRPRSTSPAPDQADIDRDQMENHARQQLQKTSDSATRIGKKGGPGK